MKAWYYGLAERERRFVLFGAIGAALIVLLMIVVPLNRSAAEAEQRVAAKTADLAWMRSVAPALASAGPAIEAPATQESIVVLVDRAARESGLGGALTSSEPSGDDGQRVRLEKAPFDVMVAWLARLREQHGVVVSAGTVDSAGEPGLVNASLVLRSR